MGVQNFFTLIFWPTGPPGSANREIRPFWPRTAFGTYRKTGRGLKAEKHNFLALGVPKSRKKRYHTIRNGCPQKNFYGLRLAQPDPYGREIAKYGYFRPFWPRTALGTWRNPGAGPKTEKCNFPVLGALLAGKSGLPKSFSPKVRNFFILYILAGRTPTGGKLRNTGLLEQLPRWVGIWKREPPKAEGGWLKERG